VIWEELGSNLNRVTENFLRDGPKTIGVKSQHSTYLQGVTNEKIIPEGIRLRRLRKDFNDKKVHSSPDIMKINLEDEGLYILQER
jgi:hypothetical protein